MTQKAGCSTIIRHVLKLISAAVPMAALCGGIYAGSMLEGWTGHHINDPEAARDNLLNSCWGRSH